MTERTPTGLEPPKKKKKYADILRITHKKLRGGQTVPMDINKINASFEKTQGK